MLEGVLRYLWCVGMLGGQWDGSSSMGRILYTWSTEGREAPHLCGMGPVENSVSMGLWDQEQAGACALCMAVAWP